MQTDAVRYIFFEEASPPEGNVNNRVFIVFLDIMKSKSNPDFMKKEQSASSRHSRGLRSKVSVCRVICCFCGRNVFRVGQRSCFTESASSVSFVCFIRQSVTEQVSWDS